VALLSGVAALLSQLLLSKFLSKRTKHASYTAHTIVAMALMVLVSSIGVAGWWLGGPAPATAAGRLMEPVGACRWLAAVVAGAFALWDVPASLAVRELRKPDVIAHHVAMTIVAAAAALHLPTHYAFFYLGVSELSSIPLLCYDQLQVIVTQNGGNNPDWVVPLRDRFKVLAALSFTAVRAWLFTKVTLFQFVPDCLHVLPTTTTAGTAVRRQVLRFGMWASLGFTALQLYWFSMIVRVMATGGEEDLPEADTA
jgi:hypothetical protein